MIYSPTQIARWHSPSREKKRIRFFLKRQAATDGSRRATGRTRASGSIPPASPLPYSKEEMLLVMARATGQTEFVSRPFEPPVPEDNICRRTPQRSEQSMARLDLWLYVRVKEVLDGIRRRL